MEHSELADVHLLFGLFLAGGTDINEELIDSKCLPLSFFLLVDDTDCSAGEADPVAHQGGHAHSADRRKAQEALVIDVRDDDADLVCVGSEHYLLAVLGTVFHGNQVAEDVCALLISIVFHGSVMRLVTSPS